ncbi:hypothetical protein ACHAW6_001889 [Cyclotella cf. meneghiniana]
MVQIFTTDFGWGQSYPMSCKSQAHDALGLLFAMEGVPPKMIVDNAKEIKLGEFARKCKEDSCYLHGTEPYCPWSNSTEHEIRELKKDGARKLTCSDGHVPKTVVSVLVANAIAEALYAQCDPDGNQYVMLDAIMDYQKNPNVAVSRNNQVKVVGGKKVVSRSTRSWELCHEWKDGSTSWKKLSNLKESHPIQVAEFALAAGIADEPAFNCAQYHKRTQKFGIEFPKTVDEAYATNKATGTTLWRDAIELEMKNVCVAFDILADGVPLPRDHQCMRCHMIFDFKMEDFCCKTWLVAGGHMTKAPATPTYASVISQETMQIALLTTALNNIDKWAANVLNGYITMPCHEKIWTTLGREFGEDCGRKAVIVRALYGLKSSGAAFRVHLAGCPCKMKYCLFPADPDLWLKEQTDWKGNHYYVYILCYVDDLLVVHHNPKRVMDKIDSFLPLKPG